MGRLYTTVNACSKSKCIDNLKAFIDTGSDLTIISTKLAKKLGITSLNIERKWTASDGDERHSPLTEIELKTHDEKSMVFLDEVLIDDSPLDKESKEDIIIGLDYLQKTKKILKFDD
jgi:predicted aspartyl protease